jgi:hypothetical protein
MLKQTRLSVSSVSPSEWEFIMGLSGENENNKLADDSAKAENDEAEPSE